MVEYQKLQVKVNSVSAKPALVEPVWLEMGQTGVEDVVFVSSKACGMIATVDG